MQREIGVEGYVVHRAERAGFFVRKVMWPNRRGAADRVFARADLPREIWIEFKKDGKEPQLLQTLEHEEMRAAGMSIHVCDNVADALKILGLK